MRRPWTRVTNAATDAATRPAGLPSPSGRSAAEPSVCLSRTWEIALALSKVLRHTVVGDTAALAESSGHARADTCCTRLTFRCERWSHFCTPFLRAATYATAPLRLTLLRQSFRLDNHVLATCEEVRGWAVIFLSCSVVAGAVVLPACCQLCCPAYSSL